MIIVATDQPVRLQRFFSRNTRISIQVLNAGIITIAREQGEAQNPNDGIQLTAANTSAPSQPYETWWKGDFWYKSNVPAGLAFVILFLAED